MATEFDRMTEEGRMEVLRILRETSAKLDAISETLERRHRRAAKIRAKAESAPNP